MKRPEYKLARIAAEPAEGGTRFNVLLYPCICLIGFYPTPGANRPSSTNLDHGPTEASITASLLCGSTAARIRALIMKAIYAAQKAGAEHAISLAPDYKLAGEYPIIGTTTGESQS